MEDIVDKFVARLREFDALRDSDTTVRDTVDHIRPCYTDGWPAQLHPEVRQALRNSGIAQPYHHQTQAIEEALKGSDVVLESPTASGKTLAFTAPMVHFLKTNPGSHALMIYPMKALAFDQREQIRQICEPIGIESWPYDGDTDEQHKKALRQEPPPIILTNPEYLNMSFLGSRAAWDQHLAGAAFLRNLRFVVIDEMHEYRGFFGSNMALLLRRFFHYLDSIGSKPQLFLSTATCQNPREHAASLTGRDVAVVSARNVLRPKREFIFVDPDVPDFRYTDILRLRVEQAALAALKEGLQVLVFCPSKRFLESAFQKCRREAATLGLDPGQLSAFHADLQPDKRQRLQQEIKKGHIRIVFTTNALEIGLDVGGLDGVILAGFPSNIMSAWQQIGRAGRAWNKSAFVLFYAFNDPIDRFFVGNLDAFLKKPLDELVVDPSNEELIKNHLPSLLEEAGGQLTSDAEAILGAALYEAARDTPGKTPAGFKPQQRLSLRGGIGQSYKIMKNSEELGQISAMRRFREAYIGAIFPFFGQRYRVKAHEEQAVVLEDVEQHLRTEPSFYTVLTKSDIFDGRGHGEINVYFGSLSIVKNYTGYKLVDERSGDVIHTGGDNDALFLNKLHSLWIDIPKTQSSVDGIGAIEHMIRVGAMFVIPADRFDTSTHSRIGNEVEAFSYENYPGGIGVAKKLFAVWHVALAKGMEVAKNCKCASGCQNCIEPAKSWDISNGNIDKMKGIALAEELLAAVAEGPDSKYQDGLMLPV